MITKLEIKPADMAVSAAVAETILAFTKRGLPVPHALLFDPQETRVIKAALRSSFYHMNGRQRRPTATVGGIDLATYHTDLEPL